MSQRGGCRTAEMFRGQTVRHVEDLISLQRGRPSERLIEEIQMTTRGTIHFMMVLPNHPEAVVVLITNPVLGSIVVR
jgi:hypothetical protein